MADAEITPNQPHDGLFKPAFFERKNGLGLLRSLLPADVVAALDLRSFKRCSESFVDETLAQNHSDCLFQTRFRGSDLYFYFLVEHQSSQDPLMAFRLLRYLVKIWDWWTQDRPDAKRLPPIVPLVVYHGDKPWSKPQTLRDLIDMPSHLWATLEGYIPSFRFLLDDLALASDDELKARPLSPFAHLTLLLLKHARHSNLLDTWNEALDQLQHLQTLKDWQLRLETLVRYTLVVGEVSTEELGQLLARSIGPKAQEIAMTTGEKLLEQGRKEGRQDTLLRLLKLKFGPQQQDIVDRVQSAPLADLDRWLDRLILAPTLEDVFNT